MATDEYQQLFQCVVCQSRLNERFKTLTCLHSTCDSCFHGTLEDGEKEGKCPECDEGFQNDENLALSPILAKELLRQKYTLSVWQCDSCMEEGTSCVANNWCVTCEKILCANCMRYHRKFAKEHISKNLDEMKRVDAIEMMMRKKCMNVPPLSAKKEMLEKKTQVSHLRIELTEFKEILNSSNESLLKYTDELNLQYKSQCKEIWVKYERIIENARLDAENMCKKIGQETEKEVERCRNILKKNSRILKEVEIWLLNFKHLTRENHEDNDILCGLNLLASRLPSRNHKWIKPTDKYELHFTLPDWWHQMMEPLESRQIPAVSRVHKPIPVNRLIKQDRWILPGSKSRAIYTIQIAENDNHIFLCDSLNQSIIEISENGQLVNEFLFCDNENQNFRPYDMCLIPPDQFVVCGFGENKLIFFERIKTHPFLQIQKIVSTKEKFYSVCLKNETIFCCDFDFGIHSFTKEGVEIKAFKIDLQEESTCFPRIRVDVSSGNFWASKWTISELVSFNSEGERLDSITKVNDFFDFSFTEFGDFYCNFEGIFSFFPQKPLYNFEKKSSQIANLCVFQNKMIVCFINDEKTIIEVLKIFH